jgi:hypothetical protein
LWLHVAPITIVRNVLKAACCALGHCWAAPSQQRVAPITIAITIVIPLAIAIAITIALAIAITIIL